MFIYTYMYMHMYLFQDKAYIHFLGIEHDGRQYEKECVCVYMTGSLCCTAEIGSTL